MGREATSNDKETIVGQAMETGKGEECVGQPKKTAPNVKAGGFTWEGTRSNVGKNAGGALVEGPR